MPIPGPTPYQYKQNDDPVTLAQQNGITPGQLLQANPGGYPFSVGQQINIPATYQYSAPIGPQPPTLLQQRMAQGTRPPSRLGAPYGPGYQAQPSYPQMGNLGVSYTAPARSIIARLAQGENVSMSQPQQAAIESILGATAIGTPVGPTGNPDNGYGGFEPIRGGDNTDFANTAAARYNAANNIPFLQQSRWDPRRRRYISVGQWLRQNRRGGRGRGGGRKPPEQKQQEFTLSNSFIDFNASAG